ncbi:uncharacterized protein LOC126832791 isoform X2 [Adelges cooleyi]|uniref:uncharacterized protein LOC126832791 isoform X2 n=1 Tax=Adelges cooleyi TaxID=133065 RepID=UPI00217F2A46|nr:uncharacterized protein LOC126832791 isoform X2 [Adelges cooleyi]
MRQSFALTVLAITVAAVSGFPWTAGGKGAGRTKGNNGETAQQDDRFHLQSPDGQYVFGHTENNQGRAEMRSADGTVTGYYSYMGAEGKLVYVNYIADNHGYRILSSSTEPLDSKTAKVADKNDSSNDYGSVFSEFTQRIKDTVVQKSGQRSIDLPNGGQQQETVDPLYPSNKDIPSKPDGQTPNQFPDWNQLKTSTTEKPWDGENTDQGQHQQEVILPNRADRIEPSSEPNARIANDIIATTISRVEQAQTTLSYNDLPQTTVPNVEPAQTTDAILEELQRTTEIIDSRVDLQTTTRSDIKEFSTVTIRDEPTTMRSTDEHRPSVKDSAERDNDATTVKPTSSVTVLEEHQGQQQITTEPSVETDYQTTTVTVSSRREESTGVTTFKPESDQSRDMETTTGIQHVTEENGQDRTEFGTPEPSGRIGTTVSPGDLEGQTTEAQVQEISWPEIPQQPKPVPQDLVPMEYSEDEGSTKSPAGTKTPYSRRVRRDSSIS